MFLKEKNTKIGQSTLELSVALIAVMMLIVAMLRLFVWINARMVARQVYYDSTRVIATESGTEGVYNEPTYSKVNLVGQFM